MVECHQSDTEAIIEPKESDKELMSKLAPVFRIMAKLAQSFTEFLKPENQALIKESIVMWAEYGWTLVWSAPPNTFYTCPESQEEADEKLAEYLDEEMESLRQVLVESEISTDFLEATKCFESGSYKACAMILFSLIDNQLISYQIVSNKSYKVGMGSIIEIYTKIGNYYEDKHITNQFIISMNAFLISVYKNAPNFIDRSGFINRHVLVHGFHRRDVTKLDCQKLFIALLNVIRLLDKFMPESE